MSHSSKEVSSLPFGLLFKVLAVLLFFGLFFKDRLIKCGCLDESLALCLLLIGSDKQGVITVGAFGARVVENLELWCEVGGFD